MGAFEDNVARSLTSGPIRYEIVSRSDSGTDGYHCDDIPGVRFDDKHRLTVNGDGESTIVQLLGVVALMSPASDDGTLIGSTWETEDADGSQSVRLLPIGEGAASIHFTTSRVVGLVENGEVLGLPMNIDRGRATIFDISYEYINTVTLDRKRTLFGGERDKHMFVYTTMPAPAVARIEVLADALAQTKLKRFQSHYDQIVEAICESKMEEASSEQSELLRRVAGGHREPTDDGIEAVFELE